LVGALLAYLLFNVSPAFVFMGDTGSLALGGFAASVAAFTGNALYLAVIGFCFVISVISVIAQVIYYKVTHGKRIFLMSPIHHHFQQKGFSESRISYGYFLVTLVLGLLCICTAI
jgi:phospho-N-acetylmuramoyl-pentapeptide-transferase